jgi:hypothetical protein
MFRPAIKKTCRLRAILPVALAYLLAINGVLGGFGSASGASIERDQGSSFANVICAAAAAAASDVGGEIGAPGKAHTHTAHHCVLCGAGTHGAAPDQSAVLAAFTPLPERLPGAAILSPRSNTAPPFDTAFMTSRSTRAPPLTV